MKAASLRQSWLPLLGMAAMEKGFSMVEGPHGPVIVISEQESLVLAGGARLRALEGVAVSW